MERSKSYDHIATVWWCKFFSSIDKAILPAPLVSSHSPCSLLVGQFSFLFILLYPNMELEVRLAVSSSRVKT